MLQVSKVQSHINKTRRRAFKQSGFAKQQPVPLFHRKHVLLLKKPSVNSTSQEYFDIHKLCKRLPLEIKVCASVISNTNPHGLV